MRCTQFTCLYVVELLHANLNCHLFAKHLSIGLTGTAEHAWWVVFGNEFLYEVYTIHMHGFSVVCIVHAFTLHARYHSLQNDSTAH